MAAAQILAILAKAAPQLIKQLPKLWPLLLDPKNRERLIELIRDLASQSPTRRLRGKVAVTAAIADGIAAEARSDEDRELAEGWSQRASNLVRRLDMPVTGRQARASHRQSVREQLEALQSEMNEHLGN